MWLLRQLLLLLLLLLLLALIPRRRQPIDLLHISLWLKLLCTCCW